MLFGGFAAARTFCATRGLIPASGRWRAGSTPAAFAAPAQFTFGDSPRSGLRGDALQTVDLTLSKEFPLAERFRLDLRGEFYNLLNHANFELPGHVFGASNFGAVLCAKDARAVQLGLRLSF